MKLSVIIPVYNVEEYLEKCLKSVVNQEEKDIEIICIDDGSLDNSGAICDDFATQDKRIIVYHIKNAGPAAARNLGLKKAKGEYITFVDPDDFIELEMYSSMLKDIQTYNTDICVCGFYKTYGVEDLIQNNNEKIEENIFNRDKLLLYAFKRYVYKGFGGYIWNKIFSRKVITDNNSGELILFDEKLHVGEDVLWFTSVAMQSKRNHYTEKTFYHYLQREDSLCHMGDIKKRSGSLIVYEHLITLCHENKVDPVIILWVKRFYVYIASLLAEKAYYADDYESLILMQEHMNKYKSEYIETCYEHKDWVTRIELLINNPEQAIRDKWNSKDENRRQAYASHLNDPIEQNSILYEAFYGRGMICGPYGIFRSFIKRTEFSDYQHVWSVNSEDEIKRLKEEYKEYPNVIFVMRRSDEYTKYLATSKYLINNVNFFYFFVKRKEQVYLNTWHGIPMKKLGYDVPDGIYAQHNSFRNFLQADYLLAWNSFMTEVYKKAYKLEGFANCTIVEEGSPRNDLTFKTEKSAFFEKLILFGVKIDPSKKIIIYAPTWKGTDTNNPEFDIIETEKFMSNIEEKANPDEYQVLIKLHHLVYTSLVNKGRSMAKAIPAFFDVNELMTITDILITDYSSVYFDFLVTDKPILFYITDEKDYKEYRGLYLDIKDLPGPVSTNEEELVECISNIEKIKMDYLEKHKQSKRWACSKDDGNVSERVIDIVFNGKEENYTVHKPQKNPLKKMLVLAGSMYYPEKSENVNFFLNSVDYEKYDVTLLFYDPKTDGAKEHIKMIDSRVRGLGRVHALTATQEEVKYPNSDLYNREFIKNFGEVTFYCAVNMDLTDEYLSGIEKVVKYVKL